MMILVLKVENIMVVISINKLLLNYSEFNVKL